MNDVLETFVDWKAFEYKYSNNPGMDKERVKKEKQVSKNTREAGGVGYDQVNGEIYSKYGFDRISV